MFRKAERKRAKLRMCICAPSGGGKTYTAILIASGIGGRIAMLDTENGSGEMYSHLAEYDVATLVPPYTPERYIEIIHGAEAAGYDTLIIDSLSHAWTGAGGVLEMHANATRGQENSYTAWRHITPKHNALVDAMLASPLHIIATLRTKTAYDIVKDEKTGKTKPVKIGLAPIQREGMDYEFTVVLDIGVDGHIATASKDRTGIFDGQYIKPTKETGVMLREWLESGAERKPPTLEELQSRADAVQSEDDLSALWRTMERKHLSTEDTKSLQVHFSKRKAELQPKTKKLEDALND